MIELWAWAKAVSLLRVGGVILLEISLEGHGLENPMAAIAISGLLRLEDQLEEGMGVKPGFLQLAIPSRMVRVAFRAVRPGSGVLRVMVSNMYDIALQFRFVLA